MLADVGLEGLAEARTIVIPGWREDEEALRELGYE